MIIYRYIPYEPEDDPVWDTNQFMSLLSELILRYDIQLEEALREIIQKGIPVNLFLKEGGMDDLLRNFIEQLKQQIQSLQEQYDIRPAIQQTEKELKEHSSYTQKKISDKDLRKRFQKAVDQRSFDQLNHIKWILLQDPSLVTKITHREMNRVIQDVEDLNLLLEGLKKYHFKGKEKLNREEAIKLILSLQEMEKLMENIKQSLENGDILNFDPESLKRYLGPEAYEEFIRRREEILQMITQLLEKQGKIVRNSKGKLELSPVEIRRIGRKSLVEIFKFLKPDACGGTLYTSEEGEGEQLTPITRQFQLGDNLLNVDIANSIINSMIRNQSPKPGFLDMEVFQCRGTAKSSIVILLDMSGSMFRVDRFYYAKKMILALESLIREEFKEDTLYIIGFGTFAKNFSLAQIPELQPYPVTLYDPYIRLRFDLSRRKPGDYTGIPEYFTNLQRGLALSKKLLSGKHTHNKQIILITDGVPTAHFEGNVLHINYPPSPADFEFALKEAIACREEGIIINTFLLTSEWNFSFFEGKSFIHDFAKTTKGRIFYPHPSELGKFVLADFIEEKKKLIS